MKKKIILAALMGAMSCVAMMGQTLNLRFVNLPYAECRLFVAVSADGKQVGAQMAEVTGDTVEVVFDIPASGPLAVQAFQDLNDNMTLDFDSYGRPQEPCLQQTVSVGDGDTHHELELKQY